VESNFLSDIVRLAIHVLRRPVRQLPPASVRRVYSRAQDRSARIASDVQRMLPGEYLFRPSWMGGPREPAPYDVAVQARHH
jgi:hypothetical protein